HGNDNGSAENDVEGVGTDAGDGEAVLENGQHQRAEESADYGARPTGQQRATDNGRGNTHEHDFVATGQRVDRADAKRIQHPGQTTQHAAHDKVADTHAIGLDADFRRPGGVTARGNRMQAPATLAEHNLEHDGNDNGPDNTGKRRTAEKGRNPGTGISLYREAAGDSQRYPL